MKIAFVTPYGPEYPNIWSHTSDRIRAWENFGATVLDCPVRDDSRLERTAFANLVADVRQISRLTSKVRTFAPDLIVVRWLTAIPSMNQRLAQIAPVVLEVHANDLKAVAAGSKLRSLFSHVFREGALRAASGACFVVSELADDPSFAAIPGERGVFHNGTTLRRRSMSPRPVRPKVGMAVGHPHPWQGLDRFCELADALPDIEFVVACPTETVESIRTAVSPAVSIVGSATPSEYHRELSSWTVAMGSMAPERAGHGLSSATPLKVRDYLGTGVPTVLPYWDEALAKCSDPLVWKTVSGPTRRPGEVTAPDLAHFVGKAMGKSVEPKTSEIVTARHIERERFALFSRVARQ